MSETALARRLILEIPFFNSIPAKVSSMSEHLEGGPAFRAGGTLVRCCMRGPSAAAMIPGKPGAPSAAHEVP